ncbi:MAG: multicopper oxidase family protein [Thermoleophilaceae bacterium]|nr:multicopper oxidase family protein [Thermoleophilaceae bacterium]
MRLIRLALAPAVLLAALVLAPQASAFSQPEQLHSRNGVLKATFTAAPGSAMIDGRRVHGAYTYNDQYIGPTLNVKPGDTIDLRVINKLPEETNIHFHGLHVSPAGIADNVLRRFRPGKSYHVLVKIPHDHPNGLYWYHPHLHGQVNSQVFRGMAGLVSIKGGEAEVKSLKKFKRRQIALSLAEFTPDGSSLVNPNDQNDLQTTTLVNRRSDQTISMHPGDVERWQIANISNEGFLKVGLEGHDMWIVGEDGNPTRVAIKAKTIMIPPGSRFEVLVRAKSKGTFKLKQYPSFEGFNSFPGQDLLTLKVSGDEHPFTAIPRKIRAFNDLSKSKVTTRRTWVLSFGPNNAPQFQALINGKQFDPDRIDTVAKINGVEEWTFINQTTEDHPIHLHTNDFQVVEVNGNKRTPQAPIDNYILPRSGSIKIRFQPRTYEGIAVFHCHILFHEDSGMMATIKYVHSGSSTSTVRAAGQPSVHDEAVAGARVFDAGSVEPIGGHPEKHDHAMHAHAVPVGYGPGGDPANPGVNAWLFCRLD